MREPCRYTVLNWVNKIPNTWILRDFFYGFFLGFYNLRCLLLVYNISFISFKDLVFWAVQSPKWASWYKGHRRLERECWRWACYEVSVYLVTLIGDIGCRATRLNPHHRCRASPYIWQKQFHWILDILGFDLLPQDYDSGHRYSPFQAVKNQRSWHHQKSQVPCWLLRLTGAIGLRTSSVGICGIQTPGKTVKKKKLYFAIITVYRNSHSYLETARKNEKCWG